MIKFILNDKIGLPALIRRIKYGMNLITYQRRTNMRLRSNMADSSHMLEIFIRKTCS